MTVAPIIAYPAGFVNKCYIYDIYSGELDMRKQVGQVAIATRYRREKWKCQH